MKSLFIGCDLIRTFFQVALAHPFSLATLLIFRLLTAHLVDRVNSFHDPVLQKLEIAQLHRIVHAVVFQVFVPKTFLWVASWWKKVGFQKSPWKSLCRPLCVGPCQRSYTPLQYHSTAKLNSVELKTSTWCGCQDKWGKFFLSLFSGRETQVESEQYQGLAGGGREDKRVISTQMSLGNLLFPPNSLPLLEHWDNFFPTPPLLLTLHWQHMAGHFYLIVLKFCLSSEASTHNIRVTRHPCAILCSKQVASENVMKLLTKEVSVGGAWDESTETKTPSLYKADAAFVRFQRLHQHFAYNCRL